jgi:hypothetical protein
MKLLHKLFQLVKAFRYKARIMPVHEMIEIVQAQHEKLSQGILEMENTILEMESLAAAPFGSKEAYQDLLKSARKLRELAEQRRANMAECLLVLNMLETTKNMEREFV